MIIDDASGVRIGERPVHDDELVWLFYGWMEALEISPLNKNEERSMCTSIHIPHAQDGCVSRFIVFQSSFGPELRAIEGRESLSL